MDLLKHDLKCLLFLMLKKKSLAPYTTGLSYYLSVTMYCQVPIYKSCLISMLQKDLRYP